MTGRTVVVTWMDGVQETYPVQMYRVADGVLVLTVKIGESQHIPLANVRAWKVGHP